MEGVENLMVAVPGPQTRRRSSTDSSRSATPSHIQVCVQVGTRWDGCVPLQEVDLDSAASGSLYTRSSSHSCPNLPGRITTICPTERKTSVVEPLGKTTGSSTRSSLQSTGPVFPLSWCANLCPLDDDRQGLLHPCDPGLATSTARDLEVPLGVLMSRRDSRKMQDLTLLPKAKPNVYLKVPSTSTSASSALSSPSTKSPVTLRAFPRAASSPHRHHKTSTNPHIFNTDKEVLTLKQTEDDVPVTTADYQHKFLPSYQRGHSRRRDGVRGDGTTLDDAGGDGIIPDDVGSDGTAPADVRDDVYRRGVQSGQPWRQGSGLDVREKTRDTTRGHRHPLGLAESQEGRGGQPLLQGPPTHISEPLLRQRSRVYSDDNISYVMSGLYVGNIRAAYCDPVLCRLGIQSVVDLSNMLPSQVPAAEKSICPCSCPLKTAHHRSRLCINIPDAEDADLTQYMTEVNRFVEGALRNARNVLVHSYHGRSRAPAVVIQYLMTVHYMRLNKAFSLVKTAHRPVAINKGFLKTLQQLEHRLWPAQTPSPVAQRGAAVLNAPKIKSAWN